MIGTRWSRILRVLAPALCAISLVIPLITWFIATGNPIQYFSHSLPPGQALYIFSKLFGLATIVLLWLQIMAALAKHSPVLHGFVRLTGSKHALLGIATFAAACTHAFLFIAATSLRTQHAAFELLVPTFTHGFFRTFVSLGVIAFWALLIVLFAGWRRSLGRVQWRWMHRLALLVFAAGFVHGITVGSETRFGLMTYVYAFMGLSVCTAALSCVLVSARRPRVAQGGAHAAAARD